MNITTEQAILLNTYLIDQLEKYGFGVILDDVRGSMAGDANFIEISQSPGRVLDFFLQQTSIALNNRSNDSYDELLNLFNSNLPSGSPLSGIVVEPIQKGAENYDLKSLPSYNKIIAVIDEVRELINQDNDRPGV